MHRVPEKAVFGTEYLFRTVEAFFYTECIKCIICTKCTTRTACNAQSTRQFRTTWRIAKMLSIYVLARCDKTNLSGPMKKHTTWQVISLPQ